MRFYDVTSWSYVNLDDPISYCRPPLPVKILVTKRPFDSTLESATATFGRQFKQPIAGKPGTVVLANEICVTCVRCGECLGYI